MSKSLGKKDSARREVPAVPDVKVPAQLTISDKATKRVIAPFVRIVRKGIKPVEIEEGTHFSVHVQKKPSVLLRDLSSFLSDCVDLTSLLHETVDVLRTVTKAAGATLYMMDLSSHEIYVSRRLPVSDRYKIRWKIQRGTTVASYVAAIKEYVLIDDILGDERFPEGIGYEGETIKSVLCVPVVTPDGECFAVIELYRLLFAEPFSHDDLKLTIVATGWMGAAIHQNSSRLALQRQQELNDYLLDLIKCYIGETVGMEKLVEEIVKLSKVTLTAEKGSFFVIDRDIVADDIVADLFDDYCENGETDFKKTRVRLTKERGIAGVVAKAGITINVKDAYNDARFNKEIDQKSGFITRSILCVPITVAADSVLGVLQIVNKTNGAFFTQSDEILFKTFSAYSALALHYTNINKKSYCQKRLNHCFLTLLQLQKVPCEHDIVELKTNQYDGVPANFFSFHWYVNPEDHSKLPQFCLYIMLHALSPAELNFDETVKFILMVRKLCRKNPYHNFEHAFSAFHCMFLILKRNPKAFTRIETKALLIAALCHDVDHPGVTNAFLQLTQNDLSYLYDDYFLENQQYDVITLIYKKCNMFVDFSMEEERQFLDEVHQLVLMKDMYNYFKNKVRLSRLYESQSFDWNNQMHRKYLKGIVLTSCDLSNQCKSFLISKRSLDNVYVEFYEQGDYMRVNKMYCLSWVDRRQANRLPEDHVYFLSNAVLPCVDLLRKFFPNTEDLYHEASLLLQTWKDIINVRGKKCWHQDDSIVRKSYV